jgi:hypothetical protein
MLLTATPAPTSRAAAPRPTRKGITLDDPKAMNPLVIAATTAIP